MIMQPIMPWSEKKGKRCAKVGRGNVSDDHGSRNGKRLVMICGECECTKISEIWFKLTKMSYNRPVALFCKIRR